MELTNWGRYAMFAGDGNVLLHNLMNPSHNMAYTLLDLSQMDSSQHHFTYDPIKIKGYADFFAFHPMAFWDGKIHFTMPLDNTIYEYANGKFSSKYSIETPLKIISLKTMAEASAEGRPGAGGSYDSKLMRLAGKRYFAGFTDIFETEKYIWMKYRNNGLFPGIYIMDKNNNAGNYFACPFTQLDILRTPFVDLRASFGNVLVGVLTNSFSIPLLKDQIKNLEKDEDPIMDVKDIHPALRAVLDAAKYDDNPILIFYYLK
jgi:hypothetical protein